MDRILSWFQRKDTSPSSVRSRESFVEAVIVQKQIKEFSACLQRKNDRMICIDRFFHLFPQLLDEDCVDELFELIIKKSRIPPTQLSSIVVKKLNQAISDKNFDLCEKILRLPSHDMPLPLPTLELTLLIHSCPDRDQTIRCLSMLIEKNLRSDAEYLAWIFIILFEYYQSGDETIIEHFLNSQKDVHFLYVPYGSNHVTPMMLFFHLYFNPKCQTLIDQQLSTITDSTILHRCDRWNRSYLMHLLCGQCQHSLCDSAESVLPFELSEINNELAKQCPHASAMLARFAQLYQSGNDCQTVVKAICTSQYCLPLRILMFTYVRDHHPSTEVKFDDFFTNFPSNYISTYATYLQQLVRHQNLDKALVSVIQNSRHNDRTVECTVKFLLRQGARIPDMSVLSTTITNQLVLSQSMIPFMLLEYSMYINVTPNSWSNQRSMQTKLYMCRFLQCGYPGVSQADFETFKSTLSQPVLQAVGTLIDLKNPRGLAYLCRQKVRRSLKHLGDETNEQLRHHLSDQLIQSVRFYDYRNWVRCYRVMKELL